jgi:hypothetical protein
MSVAAHAPHFGKRYFEGDLNLGGVEDQEQQQKLNPQKRSRHHTSPSGRCWVSHATNAYVVGQSTFSAVQTLFPEMDDKVGVRQQAVFSPVTPLAWFACLPFHP